MPKFPNERFREYNIDDLPSSRKDAKEVGSDIYFTGNECKNGHVGIRNTKNGTCYACARETAERNYDPDKNSFHCKRFQTNNPNYSRDCGRKRRKEKHEEVIRYQREYRENNREQVRFYAWKYMHKIRAATPLWADEEEMEYIYSLNREKTETTGIVHEVDHIVPTQSKLVCGLNCADNMRVVPRHLNRTKSNCYWPDMP